MVSNLSITYAPLPFACSAMHEMTQLRRTMATDMGLRWFIGEIRLEAANNAT